MNTRNGLAASALMLSAACSGVSLPAVAKLDEPAPVHFHAGPPPGSDPAGCYRRDATPAEIETVTEQVMLQPPSVSLDGKTLYPAVYQTETRQAIIRERREMWFETPCASELTPEFVASVQRALRARGHYRGPIDGQMTPRTRAAIRAYQQPQGLDSAVLSKAAARRLGLVAYGEAAGDGNAAD